LLDITQAGYIVTFNPSGENVMKVELTKKDMSDFYDYTYCGLEGESRERVEKDIIAALNNFRNLYSIPSVNHEAADPGSEPKDGSEREESDQRDEELDNTGALA
jgi:hypothetical protein